MDKNLDDAFPLVVDSTAGCLGTLIEEKCEYRMRAMTYNK